MAGAYYGVPDDIRAKAETFLDGHLLKTLHDFERIFEFWETSPAKGLKNKGFLGPCPLDRDVAALYGVETRIINQAVKNNPGKFPAGYVVELTQEEIKVLRSKILTLETNPGKGHHSKHGYKVFTEKGLYMLATILKGEQAVRTTLSIIETYAEVRAMKRELLALHAEPDAQKRNSMMRHFGEALTDIVMPDLTTAETESSLEINFLIGKLKHTVRRVKKAGGDSLHEIVKEVK